MALGRSRLSLSIALVAALAVGAANATKAVHIDDALYLAVAKQILKNPLDPYGALYNWQDTPELLYKVSISPPLLSYYFAAVIAAFGESVVLLHLSMIPWLLLLAWGLVRFGERFAGEGLWLALLVLLAPAVVVGTNLMLDVPMTAAALASVEWSFRSVDRAVGRDAGRLAGVFSGVLAATAVLIKYPAVALLPVLLFLGFWERRTGPAIAAVLAAAALAGWQTWSAMIYDLSQVGQSLRFLSMFHADLVTRIATRLPTAGALLAMSFPIWILTFGCGRRRIASAVLALLLILMGVVASTGQTLAAWREQPVFAAAAFLGLFATIDPIAATLFKERPAALDRDELLLLLWLAGFGAVLVLFGPFLAVRSFLPIQPALAALLWRRYPPGRARTALFAATLALAAALSTAIGWVDYRWAAIYPRVARQLGERYEPEKRPVYFLGHWGWQYYAEKEGMRPWDALRREFPQGALLVVPLWSDRPKIDVRTFSDLRDIIQIEIPPAPLGLTTCNRKKRILFYDGNVGRLPWWFAQDPSEAFFVLGR